MPVPDSMAVPCGRRSAAEPSARHRHRTPSAASPHGAQPLPFISHDPNRSPGSGQAGPGVTPSCCSGRDPSPGPSNRLTWEIAPAAARRAIPRYFVGRFALSRRPPSHNAEGDRNGTDGSSGSPHAFWPLLSLLKKLRCFINTTSCGRLAPPWATLRVTLTRNLYRDPPNSRSASNATPFAPTWYAAIARRRITPITARLALPPSRCFLPATQRFTPADVLIKRSAEK